MNKRFLFSMKAHPSTQGLLAALAAAKMITASSCIQVFTSDEQVAALLERLHDVERIETAVTAFSSAGTQSTPAPAVVTKTENRERRKYSRPPKPDVECPKCRRPVSPMYMLKDGSMCKMCSMKAQREKETEQAKQLAVERAAAIAADREKASSGWGIGNPQSDEHRQENLAEVQARPKEKMDLSKLTGKKLG